MPIPLNSACGSDPVCSPRCHRLQLDDSTALSEVNYRRDGKNWKVVYGGYDSKRSLPCLPIWELQTAVSALS